MNGTRSGNIHNLDKPFPGCLGRMMDLFDLNAGVAQNKLLSDRPHREGSLLLRSQSDLPRMPSPRFEGQIEDKMILSNGKANGTPMKMLIDQEMSKEIESKHNPPNVVAKLMGLDTLPQNAVSAANKNNSRGYYQAHDSEIPSRYWGERGYLEKGVQSRMRQFPKPEEYKNGYEIWKNSPKTSCGKEKSPYKDSIDEKKMALVRQKFMEAKRLATDEKMRQSKEFQDAIEVLSSNRDLFVKFLQYPTSLISHNLYEFQSIPASPETKCITILRPSKMVDKDFAQSGHNYVTQMQKSPKAPQTSFCDKSNIRHSQSSANRIGDHVQPTRIVVLKPNPVKTCDFEAVASTPCSIPVVAHRSFDEDPEEEKMLKSRVTTRDIQPHTRAKQIRLSSDEILLSSIYSNGYSGYDNSDNEFAAGILSDSEVMSPSPRLSWEGVNRYGSPYSSSSFGRVSCSPESSVCREAKKRLSERWAMMASNGNSREQRHIRRSSSTLGEMLALSETKKSIESDHENGHKELEGRKLSPDFTNDSNKRMDDSSKFLGRSKSLPTSSPAFGTILNVEVSKPETRKADGLKELTKAKSMKSSFRGKVSSLFSSKSKKPFKEKHNASSSKDDFDSTAAKTSGPSVDRLIDAEAHCEKGHGLEERSSVTLQGSTTSSLNFNAIEFIGGAFSSKAGLLFPNQMTGNVIENLEQPSPVSVLEPPFEEDDNTILGSSGFMKSDSHALLPVKSNLIDKSPPIESIARTLTWDSSLSSPYSFKTSSVCENSEEEQQKWRDFVQTVLSAAGLDGQLQSDSIFRRWHSLEHPLDPSLREKYANTDSAEPLHEAKRRQLRSSRKLIFDCINAALVDITVFGSQTSDSISLADCICNQMKEWFPEARSVPDDDGDSDSLVVEKVVRKEVVGKGWVEALSVESNYLGKEIELKLLEALVEEAAIDLIGTIR